MQTIGWRNLLSCVQFLWDSIWCATSHSEFLVRTHINILEQDQKSSTKMVMDCSTWCTRGWEKIFFQLSEEKSGWEKSYCYLHLSNCHTQKEPDSQKCLGKGNRKKTATTLIRFLQKLFSQRGWTNSGRDSPERLWNLHPWRYSKLDKALSNMTYAGSALRWEGLISWSPEDYSNRNYSIIPQVILTDLIRQRIKFLRWRNQQLLK